MARQEAGLLPLGLGPKPSTKLLSRTRELRGISRVTSIQVAAFLGTLFLGVLQGRGLSDMTSCLGYRSGDMLFLHSYEVLPLPSASHCPSSSTSR